MRSTRRRNTLAAFDRCAAGETSSPETASLVVVRDSANRRCKPPTCAIHPARSTIFPAFVCRDARVFDAAGVFQHLRLEHVRLGELELGGLRVLALRGGDRLGHSLLLRPWSQSFGVVSGVVLRDDDGHPVHAVPLVAA